MIPSLIKNWWLLALAAIFDALLALLNISMQSGPDGSLAFRTFGPMGTGLLMGRLALAAGVCTVAAGVWSPRQGRSWLLVLNGLIFCAYGLLPMVWTGPLSFRLFAVLLAVMAMSIGLFEWASARTPGRQVADKWFLGLAGAASAGFALAFVALALRWINLAPGLNWRGFLVVGAYFGFSAICMLGLALRLNSPGVSQSGPWEALPPLGNARHAH
jgi:hypothetical protein